jgi:transketolase
MQRRELPAGWERDLPVFPADPKGIAGRDASGKVLNVLARNIPWLLGGSADLGPSNKTRLSFPGAGDFETATPGGRNLHFGVREHAMAAIVNGLSLSKLRPFGATFFIFSDYARPAIRLSAIMELPAMSSPMMPWGTARTGRRTSRSSSWSRCARFRAWSCFGPAMRTIAPSPGGHRALPPGAAHVGPQPLAPAEGVARGAYVLAESSGDSPEIILIASGSEVSLAVEAHEKLRAEGVRSRVVSMPSWDIFEDQPQAYRDSVLPPQVTARIAIGQGSMLGWERYVGPVGKVVGMKTFGASAPLKELQRKFGFEPERIMGLARETLKCRT